MELPLRPSANTQLGTSLTDAVFWEQFDNPVKTLLFYKTVQSAQTAAALQSVPHAAFVLAHFTLVFIWLRTSIYPDILFNYKIFLRL